MRISHYPPIVATVSGGKGKGDDNELVSTVGATLGGVLGSAPALVVLVGDVAIHHILPASGQVSIGRSNQCDLVVDHTSISRKHAILHVGDGYAIEDLGSANGVQVRGKRLSPHERASLDVGEVADLGATVLMVRCVEEGQLLSHARFEIKLEDACAAGKEFGLLRVHCTGKTAPAEVQKVLKTELGDASIGLYGPGEFEVLLEGANSEQCRAAMDLLTREFSQSASATSLGLAVFPRDGQTSHSLLYVANQGTRPKPRLSDKSDDPVILAPAMQELHRMIEKVAVGSISILLLGETGVGKEVTARAVHRASPRSAKPYVAFNCAAISESLLESELFGHEKGAFTGATSAKVGLLESADGGTVFLDEVGELPPSIQVKLLRVLEEREVQRVGSVKPRSIDVRFVSATNRDLEKEVAEGRFREDLLYRLNGVTLRIPPLRERMQEIQPLAIRFTESCAASLGREAPAISDEASRALHGYGWPGNIRELRNVIERAVLLADHVIGMEHLPGDKMRAQEIEPANATMPLSGARPAEATTDANVSAEKQEILDALAECGGNQTRAAKRLGISRRTLTRRLNDFEIARPLKDRE